MSSQRHHMSLRMCLTRESAESPPAMAWEGRPTSELQEGIASPL